MNVPVSILVRTVLFALWLPVVVLLVVLLRFGLEGMVTMDPRRSGSWLSSGGRVVSR